jgi:hypothetical protein
VIEYSGARIQLLDLPGIVEGASQGQKSIETVSVLYLLLLKGRGRGRQVVAGKYTLVLGSSDSLIISLSQSQKPQTSF